MKHASGKGGGVHIELDGFRSREGRDVGVDVDVDTDAA